MDIEQYKNKLYHGDCLGFMKEVPDNYFDLILTDPPYGINADRDASMGSGVQCKHAKKTTYTSTTWDTEIPQKIIFDEIKRISKHQIIFGGNYFVEYLDNSRCWLVWDKNNGSNTFADCELAWTNFTSSVRKFKVTQHGMLQEDMRNKEIRYHPTQKPVLLFKQILLKYATKGMKIFDPFLGSGTTALSCKSMGLDWWGCELQQEYINVIEKRLTETQIDLFGI